MPELYEKELASPGLWAADGGPTLITPERIDRWEKEFNRLRDEGFSFPTPYGHKLNAIPTTDADDPYRLDEAYARWNAGYIERLQKKNGKLYMLGTVPPGYRVDKSTGNLVNERDGTVIREVSPGFGDWVDGYGREHKDIIFHAALCTHPVQPNQSGFVPAGSSGGPAQKAGVRFLSAAGRISRLTLLATPKGKPMADDNDADDKDKKKKKDAPFPKADAPGGDPPLEDVDAPGGDMPTDLAPMPDDTGVPPADAMPDPLAEPPMPEEPMPTEPGLGEGGGTITPEIASQLTELMAKLGKPLLPGTNQSNIIDRILTLLNAAASEGASLIPSGQGQQTQPLDLSTEGATPDPNNMASGMGMGGGPTFMSTRTKQIIKLDPSGRALAEQAAAKEMESISAEWDKIARVAGMPATLKAICLREKAAASRYHMSLNPDTGTVLNERARGKLWFAKEILAAGGLYKLVKALSRGTPSESPTKHAPTPKPTSAPTNHDDLRAEIANRLGRKPEEITIRTGV